MKLSQEATKTVSEGLCHWRFVHRCWPSQGSWNVPPNSKYQWSKTRTASRMISTTYWYNTFVYISVTTVDLWLFLRLWFVRDIWRYTNVFWLIDWLIDWLWNQRDWFQIDGSLLYMLSIQLFFPSFSFFFICSNKVQHTTSQSTMSWTTRQKH